MRQAAEWSRLCGPIRVKSALSTVVLDYATKAIIPDFKTFFKVRLRKFFPQFGARFCWSQARGSCQTRGGCGSI